MSLGEQDQVGVLASQIAVGDMTGLAEFFLSQGAPVPSMTWAPDPYLSGNAIEHRFAEICSGQAGPDGAIGRQDLQLDEFGGMAEWITILARRGDGALYYTHIGSAVAAVLNQNMIGREPGDFDNYLAVYLPATYQAAAMRNTTLLAIHRPPGQNFATTWRRSIVPLVDDQGRNDGFLVLNCVANDLRAGLEILPASVLIADADLTVCYANKEARKTFDRGAFGPWTRSLFDYSGLDLRVDASPDDILRRGVPQGVNCRHVGQQRIGTYRVTLSAAMHYGSAFYVLLVQRLEDLCA